MGPFPDCLQAIAQHWSCCRWHLRARPRRPARSAVPCTPRWPLLVVAKAWPNTPTPDGLKSVPNTPVVLPLVPLDVPATPAASVPVAVAALFTSPRMPYAVPDVTAFESPWMAGIPGGVGGLHLQHVAAGAVVPDAHLAGGLV
jgi:hypothetical protein